MPKVIGDCAEMQGKPYHNGTLSTVEYSSLCLSQGFHWNILTNLKGTSSMTSHFTPHYIGNTTDVCTLDSVKNVRLNHIPETVFYQYGRLNSRFKKVTFP